jgi:hypothetical protein
MEMKVPKIFWMTFPNEWCLAQPKWNSCAQHMYLRKTFSFVNWNETCMYIESQFRELKPFCCHLKGSSTITWHNFLYHFSFLCICCEKKSHFSTRISITSHKNLMTTNWFFFLDISLQSQVGRNKFSAIKLECLHTHWMNITFLDVDRMATE